jgi:hypothetical protein
MKNCTQGGREGVFGSKSCIWANRIALISRTRFGVLICSIFFT